jgi:hypothetical protein
MEQMAQDSFWLGVTDVSLLCMAVHLSRSRKQSAAKNGVPLASALHRRTRAKIPSRRINLVTINAGSFMYIMCSGAISNILGGQWFLEDSAQRNPEEGLSNLGRRFWAQLGDAKKVLLAHSPSER